MRRIVVNLGRPAMLHVTAAIVHMQPLVEVMRG
jgi:hypothetical protein